MSRSRSIESSPLCLSSFNPSASFLLLLCALVFQNCCISRSIPPSVSVSQLGKQGCFFCCFFFFFNVFLFHVREPSHNPYLLPLRSPGHYFWSPRPLRGDQRVLGQPQPTRVKKNRQCLNKVTTLRHCSSIQLCSKTPCSALNSKPALAERVEEAVT